MLYSVNSEFVELIKKTAFVVCMPRLIRVFCHRPECLNMSESISQSVMCSQTDLNVFMSESFSQSVMCSQTDLNVLMSESFSLSLLRSFLMTLLVVSCCFDSFSPSINSSPICSSFSLNSFSLDRLERGVGNK